MSQVERVAIFPSFTRSPLAQRQPLEFRAKEILKSLLGQKVSWNPNGRPLWPDLCGGSLLRKAHRPLSFGGFASKSLAHCPARLTDGLLRSSKVEAALLIQRQRQLQQRAAHRCQARLAEALTQEDGCLRALCVPTVGLGAYLL